MNPNELFLRVPIDGKTRSRAGVAESWKISAAHFSAGAYTSLARGASCVSMFGAAEAFSRTFDACHVAKRCPRTASLLPWRCTAQASHPSGAPLCGRRDTTPAEGLDVLIQKEMALHVHTRHSGRAHAECGAHKHAMSRTRQQTAQTCVTLHYRHRPRVRSIWSLNPKHTRC